MTTEGQTVPNLLIQDMPAHTPVMPLKRYIGTCERSPAPWSRTNLGYIWMLYSDGNYYSQQTYAVYTQGMIDHDLSHGQIKAYP